jgi:23S rRNA pseudouridine2605 synthase
MEPVRLNKFLAQHGVASRRGADALIARGKVTVDGAIVTELGVRVDPENQRVEVDGVVLEPEGERPRYYLLNKPAGVVCTNDPKENRKRAIDLIGDRKKGRIYTVGRLDAESEGLVILTNDGELANRLAHPRFGVKKTYWVHVKGRVAEEDLERMRAGVRLAEGWAKFERVRVLKRTEERTILLITLGEGKNREVRRLLAALALPVRTLRRVAIGPLVDRRLKVGAWRPLLRAEVEALRGGREQEGETDEVVPVRRKRRGARAHGSARGGRRGDRRNSRDERADSVHGRRRKTLARTRRSR